MGVLGKSALPLMLYDVPLTGLSVLTHNGNPLAERNGFRQVGRVVPVEKPGFSVTFRRRRPAPPPPTLGLSSDLDVITAPPSRTIDKTIGVRNTYLSSYSRSAAFLPANDYERVMLNMGVLSGPSGFHKNIGLGTGNVEAAEVGLSSWLSKKVIKPVISNPVKALVTTAAKVTLGGATLITESGVLGKRAKAIGKKAETVAAGFDAGAVTGAVTSGGNPLGAVLGGIAGGANALNQATKTRNPGDIVRASYQSAIYGGAAGATTWLPSVFASKPNAPGGTSILSKIGAALKWAAPVAAPILRPNPAAAPGDSGANTSPAPIGVIIPDIVGAPPAGAYVPGSDGSAGSAGGDASGGAGPVTGNYPVPADNSILGLSPLAWALIGTGTLGAVYLVRRRANKRRAA